MYKKSLEDENGPSKKLRMDLEDIISTYNRKAKKNLDKLENQIGVQENYYDKLKELLLIFIDYLDKVETATEGMEKLRELLNISDFREKRFAFIKSKIEELVQTLKEKGEKGEKDFDEELKRFKVL